MFLFPAGIRRYSMCTIERPELTLLLFVFGLTKKRVVFLLLADIGRYIVCTIESPELHVVICFRCSAPISCRHGTVQHVHYRKPQVYIVVICLWLKIRCSVPISRRHRTVHRVHYRKPRVRICYFFLGDVVFLLLLFV